MTVPAAADHGAAVPCVLLRCEDWTAVSEDFPHVEGVSHRFLEVGGLRVHVAEAGEGEPLVLQHLGDLGIDLPDGLEEVVGAELAHGIDGTTAV